MTNVAKAKYVYCVITKAPNREGNWFDDVRELPGGNFISLKTKAFEAGEILILDDNGREVGYPQRRPNKWAIEYQVFPLGKLGEAIQRADSAFNEGLPKATTLPAEGVVPLTKDARQ